MSGRGIYESLGLPDNHYIRADFESWYEKNAAMHVGERDLHISHIAYVQKYCKTPSENLMRAAIALDHAETFAKEKKDQLVIIPQNEDFEKIAHHVWLKQEPKTLDEDLRHDCKALAQVKCIVDMQSYIDEVFETRQIRPDLYLDILDVFDRIDRIGRVEPSLDHAVDKKMNRLMHIVSKGYPNGFDQNMQFVQNKMDMATPMNKKPNAFLSVYNKDPKPSDKPKPALFSVK